MEHVSRRERTTSPQALPTARVSWFVKVSVLACTCLVVVLPTDQAQGATRQWQAGARLGMAWLDGPRLGASAEAYLRHGLSDSFDLDLQILTSLHPCLSGPRSVQPVGSTTSEPGWALALAPGIVYRWDVLRAIPFAGVGLGFYEWGGVDRELDRAQFGASGRLGLDYLLTRDVVLSAQTSAHFAVAESGVRVPWFQLGVGAAHVWGW
jgi:hypothetical protein